MASITKDVHQPPKSPFWIACFNGVGSDGRVRRFKRSTKTTDRKLAQKLADEWEQLEKSAGEGRLTESQCRKVIAQMYERTVGEPLHFKTVREYLTEWVESKKNETEVRAWLKYDQIVTEFLAHVGAKADRLLREITPADIRSFRDALKRKGLAAPSEDWKGAILCGYYTGLRLRDIADLEWGAVDLDGRIITVTTRKTRKRVAVPIHPRFAVWLEKKTRGIGKAPVFPTLAGKAGGGKSGLSMAFKRIMEHAEIKGRLLREANGEGRSQSSLSFHSLRHGFVSAMANAGVAQELRQKLTGHASAEMNAQYTHHELEALRAAVSVIPSIGGK